MTLSNGVTRAAVLSLHTSPLAQPGTGDSGGMNVYVRELVAALSHVDLFLRHYHRVAVFRKRLRLRHFQT